MRPLVTRVATVVVVIGLGSRTAGAQSDHEAAAPAEYNGAVRFLRDVGSDYKNFFSKETAGWLGLGLILGLEVHPVDQKLCDCPPPEQLSVAKLQELRGGQEYGLTSIQFPVAVGWWIVGRIARSDRDADAGRDLVRAQLSAMTWTYAIKYAADRTRPNGDPRSFPSGHASSTFATAMVLQEHYGWKLGVPAFALAAYTAASRVSVDKHWASDVMFGSFLGMASGRTVTLHVREKKIALAPLAVPGGGGVIVSASR